MLIRYVVRKFRQFASKHDVSHLARNLHAHDDCLGEWKQLDRLAYELPSTESNYQHTSRNHIASVQASNTKNLCPRRGASFRFFLHALLHTLSFTCDLMTDAVPPRRRNSRRSFTSPVGCQMTDLTPSSRFSLIAPSMP